MLTSNKIANIAKIFTFPVWLALVACGGLEAETRQALGGKGDSAQIPPDLCFGNEDCAAEEYCEFGDGTCLLPTMGIMNGVCTRRPEACYMLIDPVCGCDGQTYSNDCMAHQAGTSVAEKGECK